MLLERFLKPVGFMLEIPCKLSCSNIPGTDADNKEEHFIVFIVTKTSACDDGDC